MSVRGWVSMSVLGYCECLVSERVLGEVRVLGEWEGQPSVFVVCGVSAQWQGGSVTLD